MAVFLAFFGIIVGTHGSYGYSQANNGAVLGVLGGPVSAAVEKFPLASQRGQGAALFPDAGNSKLSSANTPGPFLAVAGPDAALFPAGIQMTSVNYTVKKKDTLLAIAKTLGVSQKDLLASNPSLKGGKATLKVGSILTVAVSVKSEDSANSLIEATLQQDSDTSSYSPADLGTMTLSAAKAYFKMPADGFNWGKLHNYNAVDIANVCGTPIVAPADGIVVNDARYEDNANGDWNGGYGHFVLLEHGNGTKTRMAHLDKVTVSVGDLVKKGQQIGTMGQTGDATGCHVHFEVIGAPNPFAKS